MAELTPLRNSAFSSLATLSRADLFQIYERKAWEVNRPVAEGIMNEVRLTFGPSRFELLLIAHCRLFPLLELLVSQKRCYHLRPFRTP